jgi:hypothetical protein
MVAVSIGVKNKFAFIRWKEALCIFVASHALSASNVHAESLWKPLYQEEEHDAYLGSIYDQSKNNEITVWVLLNLKKSIESEGKIKSVLTQRLYDCKNDRFTFLRFEFYSEMDGKGLLLNAEDTPYKWKDFDRTSRAKLIQTMICRSTL